MAVTDLQNIEITKGKHYHAWALLPTVVTLYTGQQLSSLHYTASMQPHRDRSTARRHAKQMAESVYGKGGYMALLCGGGEACPLLHYLGTPFAAQVEPSAAEAFTESGAKAMLTPHHAAKEEEK